MADRTGGCQCGEIRYVLSAAPLTLYVCHCRDCQKQSASGFGMSMPVPREAFRLVEGEPKLWRRIAASGRTVTCASCPNCGTRIYHAPERNPAIVNMKPGTDRACLGMPRPALAQTSNDRPHLRSAASRLRTVLRGLDQAKSSDLKYNGHAELGLYRRSLSVGSEMPLSASCAAFSSVRPRSARVTNPTSCFSWLITGRRRT
jgi:hypothetical protein